ncbi:hypothetical protein FOXYSP1_18895 [Fusarium oxysporum f. sp. phaseoli]
MPRSIRLQQRNHLPSLDPMPRQIMSLET